MESVEGKAEKNDLSNIYIKECRVTQKKERTKCTMERRKSVSV